MSGIMPAAVRDQRIARNPCVGLTLPWWAEPRQRFLTLDELHRLAAEAGEYRVMVLVLGLCGLRIGECLALRVRSVDGLRRRLRVSESVSEVGGKLIWFTPKNHQSRDVPMPRTVADLVVAKTVGRGPGDLLFTSPEGEPIRLPNWRRRVSVAATVRAGLAGLTLRTCGTRRHRWRSRPGHRCGRAAHAQTPGRGHRESRWVLGLS